MYIREKDSWDIVTGVETLDDDGTAEEQRTYRKRENKDLATASLCVVTSVSTCVCMSPNCCVFLIYFVH